MNILNHIRTDKLEDTLGRAINRLLIDNYIAIFKIDESEKKVYVITIQYQGRNM